MASNQLPQAIRTALAERLDFLFGRVLRGFPCPLTYLQRTTLARCNMTPEELLAVETVETLGLDVLNRHTRVNLFIPKTGSVGHTHMQLSAWDCPERENQNNMFFGLVNKPFPGAGMRTVIRQRLGADVANKFFEWLTQAVDLSEDIFIALDAYADIMKMVKTAGHLRRMVPELYRLTTLNQIQPSRSSSVPYEWSSYPRWQVEQLTNTIAKCLLLPDHNDCWKDRGNHTWPVMRED